MFRHVADDRNEAAFDVRRYDRLPVTTDADGPRPFGTS